MLISLRPDQPIQLASKHEPYYRRILYWQHLLSDRGFGMPAIVQAAAYARRGEKHTHRQQDTGAVFDLFFCPWLTTIADPALLSDNVVEKAVYEKHDTQDAPAYYAELSRTKAQRNTPKHRELRIEAKAA